MSDMQPTNLLRWRKEAGGIIPGTNMRVEGRRILQQAWCDAEGKIDWRDVPDAVEDLEEKAA